MNFFCHFSALWNREASVETAGKWQNKALSCPTVVTLTRRLSHLEQFEVHRAVTPSTPTAFSPVLGCQIPGLGQELLQFIVAQHPAGRSQLSPAVMALLWSKCQQGVLSWTSSESRSDRVVYSWMTIPEDNQKLLLLQHKEHLFSYVHMYICTYVVAYVHQSLYNFGIYTLILLLSNKL